MATILYALFGLYALWILVVLAHVRGRHKISHTHWMYRVYFYGYGEDTVFKFIYTRDLILLPFYIVLERVITAFLLILFGVMVAVIWVVARIPLSDKPELLEVHDRKLRDGYYED